MHPIKLIGFASGLGSRDHGCADGPQTLHSLNMFQRGDTPDAWEKMIRPDTSRIEPPVTAISQLCYHLADCVQRTLESNQFPLVVGGDHTCAIGTWSGVHQWLGQRGPLGLIWIDAHMDSHTYATTPSGALNGMALACLLGFGEKELTEIFSAQPKVRPEHVCLLGVRSFEEGEAALLQKLGVRVIGMKEIRERGVTATMADAIAIASNGTAGFGISLDLDVLDPAEAPGVGNPVPEGLLCHELGNALRQFRNDPSLLALEIVEYNPHLDREQLTARAAGALFHSIMGQ